MEKDIRETVCCNTGAFPFLCAAEEGRKRGVSERGWGVGERTRRKS